MAECKAKKKGNYSKPEPWGTLGLKFSRGREGAIKGDLRERALKPEENHTSVEGVVSREWSAGSKAAENQTGKCPSSLATWR